MYGVRQFNCRIPPSEPFGTDSTTLIALLRHTGFFFQKGGQNI